MIYIMTVFATLRKRTRKGHATWTFVQDGQRFYAESESTGDRRSAKDLDDLRRLYRKFRSWEFESVSND